MLRKLIFRAAVLIGMHLCFANLLYGQHVVVIRSTGLGKLHEIGLFNSVWSFKAGVLPGNRPPRNVTGWYTFKNTGFGIQNHPPGWHGEGWFGIWLSVAPDLVNKKFALRINHDGASEIFMDDRPVGGYGKIGSSAQAVENIRAPRDVLPIWFNDTKPHLISIHYSNFEPAYSDFYGFQVDVGDYEFVSQRMRQANQFFDSVPWFAAAQLILGLLHFFFFLFYPKRKINLYYALFVLIVGINGIAIYLFYQTRYPAVEFTAEFTTFVCKVLTLWAAVTLLYAIKDERLPRRRMIALSTVCAAYIIEYVIKYIWFPTGDWEDYFSFIFLICIADGGWSAYQVIRTRQKGVWLVGVGVAAVAILYFLTWADFFGLWPYYLSGLRIFIMSAGQMVLPICLSLYLALDFARTNQSLLTKLSEVKALSVTAIAQEAEKRALIAGEAKRLQHLVELRTVELQEKADQLRELDTMKSRFFTNLTHEFRTPLTLIINPAKEIMKHVDDEDQQQHLRLILQNANRLLGLINQLLDLSKLEHGVMEVNNAPFNLVALINTHVQAYKSLAMQKRNVVRLSSKYDTLWLLGDAGKMDMIVLNLLSNAMKFTEGGKIAVMLDLDPSGPTFILTIRDSGSGIPEDKLAYIFERFYQVNSSDTRSAEGTGIGLALTKELVELLGGDIHAESVEGIFTEIEVRLPYQPTDAGQQNTNELTPELTEWLPIDNEETFAVEDDKPLVLLIEDHDDLRAFMQQSLAGQYRILTAKNGAEGILLALEHIPNLVITDLMMPDVDGYQVTDTLKADGKTSHIPIIILTAKTDTDSRIQGIAAGADAYLAKPFDQQELFALIDNLMATRRQLRERYSQEDQWFNNTLLLPSIEQDFIAKTRVAIESNLPGEGYNAEELAADMGLSRTQLHRKLKDLTGKAPGELIRTIRLQYAHDLLTRQIATVAEVAYMVGFSNPASFSASFSRHFGFPPKKVEIS